MQQLALAACCLGNDPRQEIAECLLEDYAKNRGFDRDRCCCVITAYSVTGSTANFLNAVAATGGPWALPRGLTGLLPGESRKIHIFEQVHQVIKSKIDGECAAPDCQLCKIASRLFAGKAGKCQNDYLPGGVGAERDEIE